MPAYWLSAWRQVGVIFPAPPEEVLFSGGVHIIGDVIKGAGAGVILVRVVRILLQLAAVHGDKVLPGLSALPQAPLAIGQDDDTAEAVLLTIREPHIGDIGKGFVCAVAAGAAYGVGTQGFDGQLSGAAPGQIGAAIVLIKGAYPLPFLL